MQDNAKVTRLFQNAKIQDLNVIHNNIQRGVEILLVVSECKDTRFECNSQLRYRYRCSPLELFQNAKIQDLNVIHNLLWSTMPMPTLFQNAKIQDLNVIHNSGVPFWIFFKVVSECKDTRFECNSQPTHWFLPQVLSCFRMQRYKIWM